MDCRTARLLLEFSVPHAAELDQDEAELLENHLHDCPECAQVARFEHEAEKHLAQAMQDVAEPAGLRNRILGRANAERRKWYRRQLRNLAAAAAVLLIAGLGLGFWRYQSRPAVDVSQLAFDFANLPASAEGMEQWLWETERVKSVLPPSYKYQYCVSANRQQFYGKLVPHLFFQKDKEYADVFVLTSSQFNLEESLKQPPAGTGRITVSIEKHPGRSDVVYLIICSSPSLDWLKNPDPGTM
jgi:hypothetical protein